jgi:hypothetical protein
MKARVIGGSLDGRFLPVIGDFMYLEDETYVLKKGNNEAWYILDKYINELGRRIK